MKKLIFAAALLTAAAGQVHAQRDTTAHTLDNVVVTGTRNVTDIRHLPMTISVVNRDKLTENQRVNVLPTLSEQVPGLFVTARSMMGYAVSDGAAGGISLRGLGSGAGRMMVLIDGHPQYQGIFGHSISDSYQTMMADRVEVLRGPASMLYGSNAMGGVVNIVTRSMREDGVKTDINLGAGSYGTFQGEFTNRIRSGKFYSVIAGQYGRSDNNRPSMGFEQYGGYAKLGYDFSPHWTAYADVNVTHFNSSYPGSTYEPLLGARQWITRGVASAVVENHYGRTSGAVSVYHNFGRHKINDGYAPGEQPQENYFLSNDALTGFSIYQSATFFTGNRITVGLDYQHIYGKAWNRVIATGEDLDPIGHHHENEIAGYVDFRQDLFRWLTVDAGVRVDHHSQTGTEWVPQGGLVFRMVKDGELKAMVSKGFRNPTIREMYLWRPANADLRPERMMNYELSWKQRLCGGAFSYGINLFYINGDNIIQTAIVDNRPMNVNTGAIENSGVEAEFAWKANRYLSLNGNYSFLHMHNKVLAAPEHKAYLGADYRRGRWMLAGGLQYIDGLYTQVDPTEIQENFLLLNVTAAYKALPWLNIWAKGENLLAQKYEINYGYPMPKATFMGGVNINI
ncbi:TonB-dependent receptor [Marseilla massiliensis]|uniref:TonB-dependent receptor n=1 Tax=Marseilla massiliensis TaxID=1841864 RepID=A0A938WUJ9_9BACT|nr:TonB-dependent receptor [Marseilla massiliensis]MBM6674896.1 TonB-dependent receptor [Marseilla massiliensis]